MKTYSFTQRAIDGFEVSSGDFTDIVDFMRKIQSENLLRQGSAPVYEMSIRINEFTITHVPKMVRKSTTEYTFYVADKIQTDIEINRAIFKKYGKPKIASIPSPTSQPAILTRVTDAETFPTGLIMDGQGYFEPQPASPGKDIDWHILNEKTDIVLDNYLRQVYPTRTGKCPAFIQELLQKTK